MTSDQGSKKKLITCSPQPGWEYRSPQTDQTNVGIFGQMNFPKIMKKNNGIRDAWNVLPQISSEGLEQAQCHAARLASLRDTPDQSWWWSSWWWRWWWRWLWWWVTIGQLFLGNLLHIKICLHVTVLLVKFLSSKSWQCQCRHCMCAVSHFTRHVRSIPAEHHISLHISGGIISFN